MKKIASYLSILLLIACNKDDSVANCNFLVNVGVSASLNMNLPEYSSLMFINEVAYIPNQGIGGVYVINVGNDSFRAWDAADPNHIPSSCSFLERDGLEVVCGCADENRYNLFTGAPDPEGPPLQCGLKEYRVSVSGNTLVVNN